MTILSNNTAIIAAKSHRGIDGSVAIPQIQDGYCIEMENTDLSTSEEIKKRPGYCRYCSDIPVKVEGAGGNTFMFTHPYPTLLTTRVMTTQMRLYDAAGVTYLNQQLGFQSVQDVSGTGNLLIATLVAPLTGRFGMIEPHEVYVSVFTKHLRPIKILSPTIFIVRAADFAGAGNYSLSVTTAPTLDYFKRVTSIVPVSATKVTVYTDEGVSASMNFYSPVLGIGTVSNIILGTSFDINYAASPVSLLLYPTAYILIYWAAAKYYRADPAADYLNAAATIVNIVSENIINCSNSGAATYFLGTGARAIPDGLETYYSLSQGVNRLTATCNGRVYLAPYPELRYDVGPYSTTQPVALAGQTLTKSSGRYAIAYANANTVYQVGDKVTLKRYDDVTKATTVYSMDVVAVDASYVYVTGTAPTTITVGEILHWGRYTYSIPLAASVIGCDSVVLFNGVSPHEVKFSNNTEVLFDGPVWFTSDTFIQLFNVWTGESSVSALTTTNKREVLIDDPNNVDNIKSSAKFTFGAYYTDDNGIVRYDGSSINAMTLPPPKVLSARSVRGSKGTFGVTVTTDNAKRGALVNAVFTFVYFDGNGFRAESEYTDVADGIAIPNAALDGSDYAELVEYKIAYPTNVSEDYSMFLNAYVTTDNKVDGAEQKFFLYKSIRIYKSYRDTFNIGDLSCNPILSVIVGDIPATALASSPVLSNIANPTVLPPRASFLVSAANRLIALGLKSFPYVKIKPTRVFGTYVGTPGGTIRNRNKFNAYMKFQLPSGLTAVTLPYGAWPGDGGTVPNSKIIYNESNATESYNTAGDNNYPAGFPAYTCYKIVGAAANKIVGAAAVNELVVAYADTSNRFKGTNGVIAAAITPKAVLRRGQREKDISTYPIKFEEEIFTATVAGAVYTFFSVNKWTDIDLEGGGYSNKLNNVSFGVFEQVINATPTPSVSLAGTTEDIYVTMSTGVLNPSLTLSISEKAFPTGGAVLWSWGAVGDFINGKYIIIHGLGSYFSITSTDDNKILSWDSDLCWYAEYNKTQTNTSTDASTTTEYFYTLTPYLFSASATAKLGEFKALKIKSINGGSTQNITPPRRVEIFSMQDMASALIELYDFSNPNDSITVTKANVNPSTVFSVGEYAVFNFDYVSAQQIGIDFPKLEDIAWKVTSVANAAGGTMTLQSIHPAFVSTAATSVTRRFTSSTAELINTSRTFVVSLDANSVPRLDIVGMYQADGGVLGADAGTSFVDGYGFLVIRGLSPSSINMQLSGLIKLSSISAPTTTTLRTELPYDYTTKTYVPIDYSAITSIKYAGMVKTDSNTYLPIPVPRLLDSGETLNDLALPMFSQVTNVAENTYIQITKRLQAILPSVCLTGLVTTDDVSVTEAVLQTSSIIITTTHGTDTTPTNSGYELTGFDGTNLITKTSDVSAYTLYGRTDLRESGIIWTDEITASNAVVGALPAFKRKNFKEINTEDDSAITGAKAFQDGVLVFKRNSLWRITFDSTGNANLQRLQSPVGSEAPFNLPTTLSYCYFSNAQGIYFTDGTTTEHVLKLSRVFTEQVNTSNYLMKRCAGYSDMDKKIVHLGLPYSSTRYANTFAVEGEANYCYNDAVFGWSMNTRIPALKWTQMENDFFFISQAGNINRIRNEQSLTKFRDGEIAIPLNIKTRYVTGEDVNRFKFWRNILFNFTDKSTYDMFTYYSIDYRATEYPLESYPRDKASKIYGTIVYGTDHFMKILRETFAERVNSIAIRLYENSVDTDAAIYGIYLEGWLQNTRLISQKATPIGERT